MRLGADFDGMQSLIGCPIIMPDDSGEFVMGVLMMDGSHYRCMPHAIWVDSNGKRFCNEAHCYPAAANALASTNAYGGVQVSHRNPTMIFDNTLAQNYGFPASSETGDPVQYGWGPVQPAWVRSYDTLEELAAAEGIDYANLTATVERFNGFADEGYDPDWHRGEGTYDNLDPNSTVSVVCGAMIAEEEPELKNQTLGRIDNPPFYACTVGLSSFGTSGGMVVNEHNQVLRNGEPIPGLYASGCVAANTYTSGGWSIAWDFYGDLNAVDHALGLGIF